MFQHVAAFFCSFNHQLRRSRTFIWPLNSLKAGGRSETSKAASGSGGFIEMNAGVVE
jgi:hypothetical protein